MAVPLATVALGLVVFPIDFVLQDGRRRRRAGLVDDYLRLAAGGVRAGALPTWLPRLVLLVLGTAAAIALVDAWMAGVGRRAARGAFWWRIVRAPLSSQAAVDHTLARRCGIWCAARRS